MPLSVKDYTVTCFWCGIVLLCANLKVGMVIGCPNRKANCGGKFQLKIAKLIE